MTEKTLDNEVLSNFGFPILLSLSCNAQNRNDNRTDIGGNFENRELTYFGIPEVIHNTDTSPGWKLQGDKLLLTGIVYEADGITPAKNVMLYYYQTNPSGIYPVVDTEERNMPRNAKGQSHGYIRSWVKTNADGKYFTYTIRPGVYPTRDEPAHVHATVKEPNDIPEYYIDDFVFDDDEILNAWKRQSLENRGGSGILRLIKQEDLWIGERDIYLGRNIPHHPGNGKSRAISGNAIGEEVFSFIPYHAYGPDKGTRTCPICKYGWYHGILYFVGNNPRWEEIKNWLVFLEEESEARKTYLKAYFVYGNEKGYQQKQREAELFQLGVALNLQHIAITYVPSFTDRESEVCLNRINPDVENTIILYKRSKIIGKYTDPKASPGSFAMIRKKLDDSTNEYFKAGKQ